MGLFDEQIQYIDKLEISIYQELQEIINAFDYVLKDYIVNKQLFREGIDAKRKRLKGYTRATIRIKISKGQPADRTTLKDEGDFHNNIQIHGFSDRFEITTNVPYDKFILKRYGRDSIKISTENLKEFIENYYLPRLKQNYRL